MNVPFRYTCLFSLILALLLAAIHFTPAQAIAAEPKPPQKEKTMNDGLYAKITTSKGDILHNCFMTKPRLRSSTSRVWPKASLASKKARPFMMASAFTV